MVVGKAAYQRAEPLPYLRSLRPHGLPPPVAPLVGVRVPVVPRRQPLISDYQFEPRGISNEGHLATQAYFYGIGLPHEVVDLAGGHRAQVFFLREQLSGGIDQLEIVGVEPACYI